MGIRLATAGTDASGLSFRSHWGCDSDQDKNTSVSTQEVAMNE